MMSVVGVLIPFSLAVGQYLDEPLKSVTHGQCDARPMVTSPATGQHRPLAGTKLYCRAWRQRHVFGPN